MCHSCPESRSAPPNSLMDLLQVLLLLLNRLKQSTHWHPCLLAEDNLLFILRCKGTSTCQHHRARHAGSTAAAEEQKRWLNCLFPLGHGVVLQFVSFSRKKREKTWTSTDWTTLKNGGVDFSISAFALKSSWMSGRSEGASISHLLKWIHFTVDRRKVN